MTELQQKIQWYIERISLDRKRFERLSYKLGAMRDRLQILLNKQYLAEQAKAIEEMKGVSCSKS